MKKFTDQERQRILDDWENSSLSQIEFCRKNGITVSSLRNWKYRGKNSASKKAAKKNPTLDLVELVAQPPEKPTSARKVFRIVTSYGATIEVPL